MLIRNAQVDGRGRCNVRLRDGRIAGFPHAPPPTEPGFDARGGRLLPGIEDPHLHLLAAVAAQGSIDARELGREELQARIDAGARLGAVRVVGYPGEERELLDAPALDALCPDAPLRVQYRSGGLWVLNSAALAAHFDAGGRDGAEFERDASGRVTGRVWRGDRLLRRGVPDPGAVAAYGARLAGHGVTAITDASADTDAAQAAVIAAVAAGLPQRLTLMGDDSLVPDPRFTVGPVKILLDEAALPPLDELLSRFDRARAAGRRIAIHCVTHAELALALAAFAAHGAERGDRIEHGALIDAAAIPVLAELGLSIVTQPGFVRAHGDRYRALVPAGEQADLYRLRSLVDGGVRVSLSSDAPYGPVDPWLGLRAAVTRRTRSGATLGRDESLAPELALELLLGGRRLDVGAPADLCLLRPDARPDDPAPVARTFIAGREVHADPDASAGHADPRAFVTRPEPAQERKEWPP